ncbi:MAG: segregation ATPase FtsK/SpoIIIE, family [Solirubrobacterales bacterium]|jgi:S-DNA-T family DNA segregation ATPase FtsK/SpoIIIE|nr:segregation ATPase FtsK/SpoIIIE, family [Solirubrobacterales bacterium]
MFQRKKRGAAARRKPKSRAKAKTPRGGKLHLPQALEQRHLDLIGLFLIAAGVYLSFVLFFGWEGGKVGYGIETGLVYLVGTVGARIVTVLMLVIGGLLVTGTSISTLFRGIGRGLRRVFLGSRGVAQTAIQSRRDRQEEKTFAFETQAGPTDVMSAYPEEDDVEPTVALVEEPVTQDFGQEIAEIEAEEEAAVADPIPEAEQVALTPQGNKRGVTISEGIDYRPPPEKALERGKGDKGVDPRDHEIVGRKLVETLGHFGVEAKIVGIVSGPHVSRYELRLAPGTKVKKVTELSNDLAYALASTDIRILAPIPGKQAVGVEVPNTRRRIVRLGDIYAGRPEKTSPLVAWLGKGIDGNAVWTDLAKMPHVLVAGTTGSGKSGCVNAILSSILMQASPNDVRLVLVDPKQVELNHYENVPHLLTPVVTSPRLAANVLANLIGEMESRYRIMGQARCRNLAELNRARAKAGEAPLPHILCVIDELADLMMVSPAEVEDSIIRLAQKSRATGIHLVLATQRPSTDIITGTIKVNIPARIAFAVSSQTDSRVILDQGGAEALLGQGDMLFRGAGTSKLQRIQGAFVTEEETARITNHWAKQGEPEFEAELLEVHEEKGVETEGDFDPDSDDLLDQAIRVVVETETASVSMIQRRLRVGYTRAGRLIDMLERRGVISGYEGSKPRQVLVTQADLARLIGGAEAPAAEPDPSPAVPE